MSQKMKLFFLACFIGIPLFSDISIPMYLTNNNQMIGTITASDSEFGLILTPNLNQLTPGIHGFHVHDKPSCNEQGMAAGNHLDPAHTKKHLGPYNEEGHLGDLPVLIVDETGHASLPVLAPRLRVIDIQGHALVIHEGGDNYSDNPPMGGGGKRIACGVIP